LYLEQTDLSSSHDRRYWVFIQGLWLVTFLLAARGVDLARLSPGVKRAESDWQANVTLGCPRWLKVGWQCHIINGLISGNDHVTWRERAHRHQSLAEHDSHYFTVRSQKPARDGDALISDNYPSHMTSSDKTSWLYFRWVGKILVWWTPKAPGTIGAFSLISNEANPVEFRLE
jgi:hypothetical protein